MMNRRNFPQSEPSRRDVSAVVKWFNRAKGFGFVQPSDGSPDAFLHISVLEQIGHDELPEGATIVCDIADGNKGPQVAAIQNVDSSTASPTSGGASRGPAPGGYTDEFDGTVKFFNAEKGFGFIKPDDGGRDVFISLRTLERAGLTQLETNQRVRVATRMGIKGPMAESVTLI